PGSIERARECAREAGLANVTFATASAKEFPGRYDFITTFDALHDMGDPVGAAAHARKNLGAGGGGVGWGPVGRKQPGRKPESSRTSILWIFDNDLHT